MIATLRRAEPASVRISKDINQALTNAAKDFKTTRAATVKNTRLDYLEDMADLKAIEAQKNKDGRNDSV